MSSYPHTHRPAVATDGGEESFDDGEYASDPDDQPIEHQLDTVAGEAPGPGASGYLPEYEPGPELTPGDTRAAGPPWGLEDDSDRPRGPPCESCDEFTRAESFGWSPGTGETIDWAVCEDCGLGWSPTEGWVDLDERERS